MARPLRSADWTRSGPTEMRTTSPPLASFSFSASSIANSSYGDTIQLRSFSAMPLPSGAILIRASVSGTCFTQTTIFIDLLPSA